ncbi:hypothetical protein NUU61_006930 [Penicillium alfredii]|uniref:Uncharacterized protein n=1 Tax=Penicillium alfredii TaxID=1506179 RepID=A0A9W9F1V3_9EURO|nr:uncharacterized protein NUU61_006930 [Penicillium alfredii]KAJ5092060.1 hypothetical protein NUU61_006930 [Penicillium alfredii]
MTKPSGLIRRRRVDHANVAQQAVTHWDALKLYTSDPVPQTPRDDLGLALTAASLILDLPDVLNAQCRARPPVRAASTAPR